jgi:hypothetical protein
LALFAAAWLAAGAGGAPPKPKPKPPPKPKLELLTRNQEGALRREAIRVSAHSRRGAEVRVKATLFVDGYPDDYYFRLGPETRKLKGDDATVSLDLSARKREVLDFAAQTCRPASVSVSAKVGKRTGTLSDNLRKPADC